LRSGAFRAGVKNFVPTIASTCTWASSGSAYTPRCHHHTSVNAHRHFIGQNFDKAAAIASQVGIV
jgi:hypothetical protein